MRKIPRTLIAVAALSTTLVGGSMAWASTTHTSGKSPRRQHVTVVTVQATNPNWIDTGVALQAHQALRITAQGIVTWGAGGPIHHVHANGLSKANYTCDRLSESGVFTFVAPSLSCFSLIGKIGNHDPFQSSHVNIGDSASGELFLMLNDSIGTFGDNVGHWTVTITTSP